jgi:hypothetical protein
LYFKPPGGRYAHFQVHLPFELEWVAAKLKYNIEGDVIRSFDRAEADEPVM